MNIDDTVIDSLKLKLSQIPKNPTVMTECHNIFAQYMEPYVPMDEGILAHNISITPDGVHYLSPYAHYQYVGIIYGPNIPIYENGVIVGWWSPPNKKSTGRKINYHTDKHSKATREWDKAMLRDKRNAFIKDLSTIIIDYLKGLNND